eukprot:3955602-Alexandrium_andersonii.AAC.1
MCIRDSSAELLRKAASTAVQNVQQQESRLAVVRFAISAAVLLCLAVVELRILTVGVLTAALFAEAAACGDPRRRPCA